MHISSRNGREFLYTKKYFAGMIVDDEKDTSFDSWYEFSNEWIYLKQKFEDGTLTELLEELICIFEIGLPNYSRLSDLFGSSGDYSQGALIALFGLKRAHEYKEEFEKMHGKGKAGMDHGDKIIYKIENIERKYQDIFKVEMDIDMNLLKINTVYLFVHEMPNKKEIKSMVEKKYNDIEITEGERFIIKGETYKIVVLKGEN